LVSPRALEKRGNDPKPRRHGPKRPRVTLSPTSGQLLRRRLASGGGKPHTRGLATLFCGPTTAVGSIQAAGLQGAGRPVRRLPDNEQVGQCLATRYLYCPRRWRSDTPDGRGAPTIAASSRRTRLRTGGKTGGGGGTPLFGGAHLAIHHRPLNTPVKLYRQVRLQSLPLGRKFRRRG
jgi:hypothetical protein